MKKSPSNCFFATSEFMCDPLVRLASLARVFSYVFCDFWTKVYRNFVLKVYTHDKDKIRYFCMCVCDMSCWMIAMTAPIKVLLQLSQNRYI